MLWKHTQRLTNQEKKVPEYPPRSVQFDLAKREKKVCVRIIKVAVAFQERALHVRLLRQSHMSDRPVQTLVPVVYRTKAPYQWVIIHVFNISHFLHVFIIII